MVGRMGTTAVFVVSVTVMALKPLLLYLTRGTGSRPALTSVYFQLAAEGCKVSFSLLALAARLSVGLPAPLWCGLGHTARFMAPAAIYMLMNVVTVEAARLLPPPTFQLLANTKILFTAVASWALLGRHLAPLQWVAMVLLTAGVALGQWRHDAELEAPLGATLLMLANSCLSALGGICTECLLKGKESAELSVFATNVHLASHSLLLGAAAFAASPAGQHAPPPRLADLSVVDAVALTNETLNGILISVLTRWIDSIAKNCAFSVSVFATAGMSALVLEYRPPLLFYAGAGLTLASIALYAGSARPPSPAAAGAEGKKRA